MDLPQHDFAIPGSPPPRWQTRSLVISWTLILAALAYVFVGVNLDPALRTTLSGRMQPPQNNTGLTLMTRYAIGAHNLQKSMNAPSQGGTLISSLAGNTKSVGDQIRVAIAAGELVGAKAARDRLNAIKPKDEQHQRDIEVLCGIYADTPAPLSTAERDRLLTRYRFFGELALAYGTPEDNPQRQTVIRAGEQTLGVILVYLFGGGAMLLVGFALLMLAIIFYATGKLRPKYMPTVPPLSPSASAPPAVFLEAFAIYLVGFILIGELLPRLLKAPSLWWNFAALIFVPIAISWPVLRRQLSLRQALLAFGWTRGRGVFIEMSCGVVGYIAALPIIVLGFVITAFLLHVSGTTATHPIQRLLEEGNRYVLFVFLLACVLAPILEETMFRGALFNHLCAQWHWPISSLIVGIIFASIHPQGWALIPVLGSIGMMLAWIRTWRGSLIASMTAHALSNALVLTLAISTGAMG